MKKLLNKIYLADWFDPIYRIINIPNRIYLTVSKFIYYGYAGTKCVDFDASCIHNLIYAHMNRVSKYMNSDKTHLVWNNDPTTKGMRKLAEFTELSRRMAENEMRDYHFYGEVKKKYPSKSFEDMFGKKDPEYKRLIGIAFKKDRNVVDGLVKRYYHLLEKEVSGFWD